MYEELEIIKKNFKVDKRQNLGKIRSLIYQGLESGTLLMTQQFYSNLYIPEQRFFQIENNSVGRSWNLLLGYQK